MILIVCGGRGGGDRELHPNQALPCCNLCNNNKKQNYTPGHPHHNVKMLPALMTYVRGLFTVAGLTVNLLLLCQRPQISTSLQEASKHASLIVFVMAEINKETNWTGEEKERAAKQWTSWAYSSDRVLGRQPKLDSSSNRPAGKRCASGRGVILPDSSLYT